MLKAESFSHEASVGSPLDTPSTEHSLPVPLTRACASIICLVFSPVCQGFSVVVLSGTGLGQAYTCSEGGCSNDLGGEHPTQRER